MNLKGTYIAASSSFSKKCSLECKILMIKHHRVITISTVLHTALYFTLE